MSLQSTNLLIQMSPIPQTFHGTPQELSAEMVRRMKILSPSGSNFIFIGDSEPTSNVGPWLKDGTKWYVWDSTVNRYVPQDITDSEQRWFWIGATTPSNVDPPLWMRTTKDATEADPTYGSPLSWYQWNGSAWVPFVGLVFSGPTANRPVAPETYQLYYDTDILSLIWWERAAWRTVDGVPGDCKAVYWETLTEALLHNPGWSLLGDSNVTIRGRYVSMATRDPGASPETDLNVPAGVAKRSARSVYGETDGIEINASSTVPYPPTIALWWLVKV